MIAFACDTRDPESVIEAGSPTNRQATPAIDATAKRTTFIFIV
jgi:hypothetical protein